MGQWDFTLKIKFAFLCVFLPERAENDRTVVLMRNLVRPPEPPADNLFYPFNDHFAVFRYSPRHRVDLGKQQKLRKGIRKQVLQSLDVDAVRFFEEELTILPCGYSPNGAPVEASKFDTTFTRVFPTTDIAQLGPGLTCKIKQGFLTQVEVDTITLAGRVLLEGGEFAVQEVDMTSNEFALFDLDKKKQIPRTNRLVARAVNWTIMVRPKSEKERFVEFQFKNMRNGNPSYIQLRPEPGEIELLVNIRNCEEVEISRPYLPTTYDDAQNERELMSFYPLLEDWNPAGRHKLPKLKLAPAEHNGSGACAPVRS